MSRSLFSDPDARQQFEQIATEINQGRETLSTGCNKLRDRAGNLIGIDPKTFKKYCKHWGINLNAHRGRPTNTINTEVQDLICQQVERPGAMKNYEYLNTNGIDVSRHEVYKIYETNKLFQYQMPKPPEEIRCKYEACQRDLIWHTDLHMITIQDTTKYLISFLDDASRLIVGWDILTTKEAVVTSKCLEQTLQRRSPAKPFVLWSDNGTEFLGEFDALLKEEGIAHCFTKPRNPHNNKNDNINNNNLMYKQLKSRIKTKVQGVSKVALKMYNCN
jgi:hypothetical protein